jgi:hypothetical protein
MYLTLLINSIITHLPTSLSWYDLINLISPKGSVRKDEVELIVPGFTSLLHMPQKIEPIGPEHILLNSMRETPEVCNLSYLAR